MPNQFEKYRVGDTIFAVGTELLCEEIPFLWPVNYGHFCISGYANWILPLPEDLVVLVGWKFKSRQPRRSDARSADPKKPSKRSYNSTASTDPTVFIEHLMRSTESSSWGSLETKLCLNSGQLRQYFFPFRKEKSEAKERKDYPARWMSIKSLKILILAASLKDRTRHGVSTFPTVDINSRPNCKPLRPTETGSMLRVLDQDELYARLGSAWRLHIRDRHRLSDRPNFEDLPWLVKKAAMIASLLWRRHTIFERRCIAKVARRKRMCDWSGYLAD